MACTVILHVLAHALVEHLPVFGQVHVNKIDHDDSSHISQSQLARQLVGCTEIGVEGVLLLTLLLGTVATVDIDDMHGLSVLYNKVATVTIVDGLAKAGLDLLGDVEVVEDGDLARVALDNALLFRRNERYIVLHRRADFVIVDVDVLVGRIEQVAQHGHCPTRLLECELRTLLRLLRLGDGLFPSTQKHLHLRIKFCDALALRHGAYDHAKILRLDALDELLQTCTLLRTLDFRRHIDLFSKGHEDKEASCEGQLRRQTGAFRRDGLLDHLHDNLLTHRERLLDAAVLLEIGKARGLGDGEKSLAVSLNLLQVLRVGVELTSKVKIVKKSVALIAYIDEAGIEAGHQFLYLCHINVAHRETCLAGLALVLHQPLVLKQGYRDFLGLSIDNYFAGHFFLYLS